MMGMIVKINDVPFIEMKPQENSSTTSSKRHQWGMVASTQTASFNHHLRRASKYDEQKLCLEGI
jgi:hypothetical protein